MTLSNFVAYVTQKWKNKPDTSTPLSAERLTHQEDGIKANSDAIQELAAAVVSQIVNNPDKIASIGSAVCRGPEGGRSGRKNRRYVQAASGDYGCRGGHRSVV